jgi:hypothetical protein
MDNRQDHGKMNTSSTKEHTMTNAELTARYNELAKIFNLPTIAPWKGKKEVLEARLAALEARLGELTDKKAKRASKQKDSTDQPTETARKTPVEKVDSGLQAFLEGALKAGATPSEAIRQMMEAFPQATRILVKHSAKAAGINPLTARNLFDRIRRTK